MRDYQRQRVYNAERAAKVDHCVPVGAGKMEDIKAYLYAVYTDKWFRAKFPHAVPPEALVLHNGGGTVRAAAWSNHWLRFPRFSRHQLTVLHEVAHLLLHPRDHQHSSHGRLFCATYLDLVRHFMGFDTFLALRQAMIEANVRFNL